MDQSATQQAFDTAVRHHQAGRLHEAEQLYRQVLADQPNHAIATHHLGLIAHQVGRNEIAADLIRRSIALNSQLPEAHSNLGSVLRELGQLDEAIASCRRAIALRPNYAEAHNNLGNALKDNAQFDEALAAFRQAIALNPQLSQAHNNLGTILKDTGQLDEAIAAFRQAIALAPDYADALNNLGNALRDKGYLDDAISACRRAIALSPNHADAHNNLAGALADQRKIDEAIIACRQAIALRPNDAEAHNNLSLALLASGDFQQGWEEHEWRLKCKNLLSPRNFSQPQWDGSPLETRTLLLHAEQGFGDAIQFIRYVPLVAQRGGKIIIECHAELQCLFKTVPNGRQIVAWGDSLPPFDVHCSLLSLPRIFRTTLNNLPNSVPYLRPETQNTESWQRRLSGDESIMKVGLVWAGSSEHKNDRNRSMKLAQMAPLAQVPGVRFFSLQKGHTIDQAKTPPAGMELVDWTDDLKDFADTAALIANLDLVIAVDTAVAHLAGAMGKPIWTLLPFASEWRWLLDRDDSPWYPTMRLFRQSSKGDWESVITRVAGELSIMVKNQQ